MKKRSLMKFLSVVLAATLCLQPAMSTTVFAEEPTDDVVIEEVIDEIVEEVAEEEVVVEEEEVVLNEDVEEVLEDDAEEIVEEEEEPAEEAAKLQNATVFIPANATEEEVQAILAEAVLVDPSAYDVQAIEWEYYCEGKANLLTQSAWGSIYGFETSKKVGFVTTKYTHPALAANNDGSYQLRMVGCDEVVTLTKENSKIVVKEGPYEVAMPYAGDDFDLTAVRAKIFDAVVESSRPELTVDDVTIQYNATLTGLTENWQNLESTDAGSTLKKFGLGEQSIKIAYAGDDTYKAVSVVVKVTFTDSRVASEVVLKEGAAITYNMDAYQMKKAIFNNAIDWENSVLPSKDEASIDDFTFEYYGENVVAGIKTGIKTWVAIEGGKVLLADYPQMGAGEQKIRVTYNGNNEYRASSKVEGTITVNKAKVSVKVKSTSMNVGESLPADFITTNPADTFDKYIIFSGVSSDLELTIYMQLPDKYTESAVLKVLDPIVKAINGKSFSDMINDGMTVGELKEFFNTEAFLEVLDKLNIDLGTLGQIIKVVDALPSVADNVRVAFGTPNRAGLYTVTVVTDNTNYETGVGSGTLLLKMRGKGTKLNWNETIPNNKLTAAEAAEFDFGVTLSYDGDVTVSQKGVKYLYSGFTSKWRVYSSTTKAPTEPGSYVQTVVTLGGNYIAAPVSRTFKITK